MMRTEPVAASTQTVQSTAPTTATLVLYEGRGVLDDATLAGLPSDSAVWLNSSQESTLADAALSGVTMRVTADYVTPAEREALIDASYQLAGTWYQPLDHWVHAHRGIELGDSTVYDVTTLLIDALGHLLTAQRALERERPGELVLAETHSLASRAFLAVARQHGIPVRLVPSHRHAGAVLLAHESLLTGGRWLRAAIWGWLRAAARLCSRFAGTRILSTDYFRFKPLHAHLSSRADVALCTLGGSSKALMRSLQPWQRGGALVPLGYVSLRRWLACRAYARRLSREWDALATSLAARLQWQDLPIFPVVARDLRAYVTTALPNARALVDGFLALIRRERIDTILTQQDLQGEHRLLVWCGNHLQRRTVCVQHGMEPDIPRYGRHIASVCAVWGEATAELFRRRHRASPKQIAAVGDPGLGSLRSPRDAAALRARMGLQPHQRVIVMACERFVSHYAATDQPQSANRHLEAVCRAVQAMPETVLIARCKASRIYQEFGGDFATKQAIIEREGQGRVRVDTDSPLYDLLTMADAVVVTHSTIGLEAMGLGKPVICVNFDGPAGDLMGFIRSGVVMVAFDEERVRRALHEALAGSHPTGLDEARKAFLQTYLANWDDADPLARLEARLMSHRVGGA